MRIDNRNIPARPRAMSGLALLLGLMLGLGGCASRTHQSQFIDSPGARPTMDVSGGHIHYALPKGLVILTITNQKNVLTIGPPTVESVADPNARFGIRVDESRFANDQFNFMIDAAGLLSSTKSDNFDETPKIIQKAVELFSETAKTVLAGRSGRGAGTSRATREVSEVLVLDPFRQTHRRSLTGAEISFRNVDNSPLPRLSADDLAAAARQCNGSLCSRLLRPVLMTIKFGNSTVREHVVLVPDPMLTVSHDVTRSACIQRITTLTFSKGVLTTYNLNKPSEVLACLSIPVEALKTLAAIPGDALTIRINQVNQTKDLNSARTESINTYIDLLEAQSRLANAAAAQEAAAPPQQRSFTPSGPTPAALSERAARLMTEQNNERDAACEKKHGTNEAGLLTCKQNYNRCFGQGGSHRNCLEQ